MYSYENSYINPFHYITFITFCTNHSEVHGSTTFHLGLAPSLVQCVHFPAPLRYRPAYNSRLFSSVHDTLPDSPIHSEHASSGYTWITSGPADSRVANPQPAHPSQNLFCPYMYLHGYHCALSRRDFYLHLPAGCFRRRRRCRFILRIRLL